MTDPLSVGATIAAIAPSSRRDSAERPTLAPACRSRPAPVTSLHQVLADRLEGPGPGPPALVGTLRGRRPTRAAIGGYARAPGSLALPWLGAAGQVRSTRPTEGILAGGRQARFAGRFVLVPRDLCSTSGKPAPQACSPPSPSGSTGRSPGAGGAFAEVVSRTPTSASERQGRRGNPAAAARPPHATAAFPWCAMSDPHHSDLCLALWPSTPVRVWPGGMRAASAGSTPPAEGGLSPRRLRVQFRPGRVQALAPGPAQYRLRRGA